MATNIDPSVMTAPQGEDTAAAVNTAIHGPGEPHLDDFAVPSPSKKRDRKKKRHRSKKSSRNESLHHSSSSGQPFHDADAHTQAMLNSTSLGEEHGDNSVAPHDILMSMPDAPEEEEEDEETRPKKKGRKHSKRREKESASSSSATATRASSRNGAGIIHDDSDAEYNERTKGRKPSDGGTKDGRKDKLKRSKHREMIFTVIKEWTKIGIEHNRSTWKKLHEQLSNVSQETGDWFRESIPANTIRRWKKSLMERLSEMGYEHVVSNPATGEDELDDDTIEQLTKTRYSNCGRHKKWPVELTEPVQRKIEEGRKAGEKDFTVPQIRDAIRKAVDEEFDGKEEYRKLAERDNLSDTTLRKIVRDILKKPLRSLQKRGNGTSPSAHYRRPLLPTSQAQASASASSSTVAAPAPTTEQAITEPVQYNEEDMGTEDAIGASPPPMEKKKSKKKKKKKSSKESSGKRQTKSKSKGSSSSTGVIGGLESNAFTTTHDDGDASFAIM